MINIRLFALAAVALLLGCGSTFATVAEETIENTYSVPAKARITVKNADGRIQVYGWEENEMKVVAYKRAFTKERLDAIEINVEVTAETVLVDTVYPPAPQGSITADRSGTVDYILLVPQYAALEKLDLANGEMLVEGMRGATINAQVGNGKLLLRNSFSPTQISLTKGIMEIFFSWWEDYGLPIRAEVVDGDLRVALPSASGVTVDATTATGRITNAFAPPREEGEEESAGDERSLSTVIGYESGTVLELRSTSANIRLGKSY